MIKALFFAQLGECGAGRGRDLPLAATAQALVEAQGDLGFLKDRSIRVAVNRLWSHWDAPLTDGDEVAFLPPPSAF